MKRQFTSLSSGIDDSEPVSKRARLLAFSPTPPIKPDDEEEEIIIDEPIISIDSQSEEDDDIIEIEDENHNRICQDIDNVIILVSDTDSDSDDDQDIDVTNDILPSVSSIINTIIFSPLSENVEIVEEEETNNDNELIDLTDDETNSTSCSSIDLQQCPICLETLSYLQSTGVYLVITQCSHVMCTLCSRQLLVTSSRCPLCRENVSSTTLKPYCILP